MNLIRGTLLEYDESDKKRSKRFIHNDYVTITQESDSDVFGERIFKLIKSKYEDLENEIEESRFSFKFVRKLENKFEKVNERKCLAYIKSIIRLRYKIVTINPKNFYNRYF